MNKRAGTIIIASILLPMASIGGPVKRHETKRQVEQQERIEQGEKSGELTPEEAKKLEKEQGRIRRTKRRALEDGKIGPHEAKKIEKMQDKASKDIYEEKHDAQKQN